LLRSLLKLRRGREARNKMDFGSVPVYVLNGDPVPEGYSLESLGNANGKAYAGSFSAFAKVGNAAIEQGFTRASADSVRGLAEGWAEKGFRIGRARVTLVSAEVEPNKRLNSLVESFEKKNGKRKSM